MRLFLIQHRISNLRCDLSYQIMQKTSHGLSRRVAKHRMSATKINSKHILNRPELRRRHCGDFLTAQASEDLRIVV